MKSIKKVTLILLIGLILVNGGILNRFDYSTDDMPDPLYLGSNDSDLENY